MYLFLCTLRCTVHLCFWIHASYICFFLIDCGLDSAPYNAIRQMTVFVPTERVIRVALTCTNKVFLRCNLTWSLSRMPMLYSFGICERPTLRWRRCIELISGCFLLYVLHAEMSGCWRSCPQDGGQVVVPSHGQGVDGEFLNGSIWYTSVYPSGGDNSSKVLSILIPWFQAVKVAFWSPWSRKPTHVFARMVEFGATNRAHWPLTSQQAQEC